MAQHGVFAAFLRGVRTRGPGGFMYVRDDECCYMFPTELEHTTARASIMDLLARDGAHQLCYVLTHDGEGLHLMVYPRPTDSEDDT